MLIDLRGHGESAKNNRHLLRGAADTTLETAAVDLATTLDSLGLASGPDMICGHSMGGKTALAYLAAATRREAGTVFANADLVPAQTWIWDSQPGLVDRTTASGEKHSVASVLDIMGRLDLPMASKNAIVESLMRDHGLSKGIAQWMTTNVVPDESGEGFSLAFHLPTANALFASYSDLDYLPLVASVAAGLNITTPAPRCVLSAAPWILHQRAWTGKGKDFTLLLCFPPVPG